MITAIDIETTIWNEILEKLMDDGWKCTYKYDNFDAGIDLDFVILKKAEEEILFGWDNWFEGEIQCTAQRMKMIENFSSTPLKFGEAENLSDKVIKLHRQWQKEKTWWKR